MVIGRSGNDDNGRGDELGVDAGEAIGEGRRLGIDEGGRRGEEKEENSDKNIILLIFINFKLPEPIWSQI